MNYRTVVLAWDCWIELLVYQNTTHKIFTGTGLFMYLLNIEYTELIYWTGFIYLLFIEY